MPTNQWMTAEDAYKRRERNKKLLITSYISLTVLLVASITLLMS